MIKKFLILCLLLILPLCASAMQDTDLSKMTLDELKALRNEADAQIRIRQLPDAKGYLDVLDGEGYYRSPNDKMDDKVRLTGDILSIQFSSHQSFYYLISLKNNPGMIFLVDYDQPLDEHRFIPGDTVTVYGTFFGISAYSNEAPLISGKPCVQADMVVLAPKEEKQLVATRENPVKNNVSVYYEGTVWSDYADFEFEITSVKRGSGAEKLVKGMSKYNITPLKKQEYFLIWLRVKAVAAPNGRAPISQQDFRFVSADGREYRQHFLINPTSYLQTIYEGTEYVAILSCIIDKGDEPLLVYQPQSAKPLWFDPNSELIP
ncbi:MAG: hypothetical protein ACOX54_09050 [Christensenellales bacterium]|jgi:hypothetical protein